MSKKDKKKARQPFEALKELKKKMEEEQSAKGAKGDKAATRSSSKTSVTKKKPKSTPEDEALALHRMMAGVTPLDSSKRRVPVSQAPLEATASKKTAAERISAPDMESYAVHEHIRTLVDASGNFEVTDDGVHAEGRRVGVAPHVLRKLRHGRFPIDARLDLHGMTALEAREKVEHFLREKRARGERCVLIVHGKGDHSPGGMPILRGEISAWLSQGAASHFVAAFASAQAEDGGHGATYVLIRP